MSDSDLIKLYSGQILALAADIPHLGRLDAPMATVQKRAPLCGSTVTVDIILTNGRVSDFAQDVKACALGQAAAAILGGAILGQSPAAIRSASDALAAMLEGGAVPPAPFNGYEILTAARGFQNRHASILLAISAAAEAAEAASAV